MFGVKTELGHIPADAAVQLEFSDPTDDDPIEWVNVHVRSSALPVTTETRTVDEASDNEPGPLETTREMVPREPNADEPEAELPEGSEEIILEPGDLLLNYEDVTKAQLQDILREKDLPTSGSKQTLVERLNEAALDS
jgi:hypothetical protein